MNYDTRSGYINIVSKPEPQHLFLPTTLSSTSPRNAYPDSVVVFHIL